MITDLQPRFRAIRRRRRRLGRTLLSAGAVALLVHAVVGEAPTVTATGARTVVVGSGDTLWAIAARRLPGDDVRQMIAEIQQLNGLTSATIQPGEELLVPAG
ncbi:MAG: LysM peptidoglycan-binding domain-containing protein [Candidatus Dormiibacterota bacterium]